MLIILVLLGQICSLPQIAIAADLRLKNVTPGLGKQEMRAVLAEIELMIRTDEAKMMAFTPKAATPDRIARLFQSQDVVKLPNNVRAHGLFLAGQSSLFVFDKPSDVLGKIATWFPEELKAAQADDYPNFYNQFRLFGPYSHWNDEAAAFVALWKCMPKIAWLRPSQSVFGDRLNVVSTKFFGIAMASNGVWDFGWCVRNRGGWDTENARDEAASQRSIRDLAPRIEQVLRKKFASFLTVNRCTGTGPDDCVLAMMLWAALAPSDENLAKAIQSLEGAVAPAQPLPPMRRNPPPDVGHSQDREPRFDVALRRAAFFLAKFESVLNAPSAWPSNALENTFHQMTQLRREFPAKLDPRWFQYDLNRNSRINPWMQVNIHKANARVQTALLAELKTLTDVGHCALHEQWLDRDDNALVTRVTLTQWQDNRNDNCVDADLQWLAKDASKEAAELRRGFLDLLYPRRSGYIHEKILTGLADGGNRCLSAFQDIRAACETWISERQIVKMRLARSGLELTRGEQFQSQPFPRIKYTMAEERLNDVQAQWLKSILGTEKKDIRDGIDKLFASFATLGIHIFGGHLWTHPRSESSLLELQTDAYAANPKPSWPYHSLHQLVVVSPSSVRAAGIPERFRFRSDTGTIYDVSDLDHDGNLEVWLQGDFGGCDGQEPKPENCTSSVTHMGEILDNSLTYFSRRKPSLFN